MNDTHTTESTLAFLREEAAHYENLMREFEIIPTDAERAHLDGLKAAVIELERLERENNQLRAYVAALEDQMDPHGLHAAQRAAGLAKAQPQTSP